VSGRLGVGPLVESGGDALRRADGLDALFAPRGVVVVGASRDPDKLGGAMAASLGGFAAAGGDVVLVNARGAAGMCATVAEAASAISTVDLAVLCIPAEACAEAVAECADAGVRAALVCAGGFGEMGQKGLVHENRLRAVAAEHGVRLLGPNTSGFFVPRDRLRASFVPGAANLVAGPVAVVAASGGLNHALAFALQRQGCGISLGVGIGAGHDVAAPEVLEYLADDPDTRSVALHIETVADGPRLLAAVRALTHTTPVVALVVGEHDIGDFARSHTGALATSWRTTRSLLREAGAVVVDDEEQLVTAASVLARVRLPANPDPGVALVTAQAGPGLLVTDALHGAGVRLPGLTGATQERLSSLLPPMTFQANPVDTGRPGPNHGRVLAAVAADPGIDLVAVYGLVEPVVDLPSEVAHADLGGLPSVIGLDGLAEEVARGRDTANRLGVAAVVGARALASAVGALDEDARRQAVIGTILPEEGTSLDAGGVEDREAGLGDGPLRLQGGPWTEGQAKDVLDLIGIATPARAVCSTDEEVRSAADLLAWPVAAKLSDADVLHKSELGGVHLGLRDHEALYRAVAALRELGAREILIESMAPSGVDLVVGARHDPVFGPVIVLGIGGIATEVYADVAIASLPSTAAHLSTLADDLQAQALLDGFRGDPVVDRSELAAVCARLGALLTANPQLAEVEVNPLRATTAGLVALDAVLLERDPHSHTSTREETP
jgi:acyl-CoA synthetase (NDP forming)